MIELWLAAGLLLLVALAFLLIPVLRGRKAQAEEDRTALNVALYQERLAELQGQHASGALTAEQLQAGQDEAARELLDDTEGAAVERVVARSLMPRFHAGFSVGTMVGAGLGALAARLDLSVMTHLAIVLPVSRALTLFAVGRLLPDAETVGGEAADRREGSSKGRAWAAWRERLSALLQQNSQDSK